MNANLNHLTNNERIIYLILIVSLVIAVITISTCNKQTLGANEILKSQVQVMADDFKELEESVEEKDSELGLKTEELKQRKKQIDDLISNGQISAIEAQRKIRQLRNEINALRQEAAIQKSSFDGASDSLANIISNLKAENNSLKADNSRLEKQSNELQNELSNKKVEVVTLEESIENIALLPGTSLSSKKGVQLRCRLPKPTKKNETFKVYLYDDENNLISPQTGIYTFQVPQGEIEYSGNSSPFKKGLLKAGKQYVITIRNSTGKEIHRSNYRIPLI